MGKGTYVSATFDEDTIERLVNLQKELGLLNPVPREKLHTTIVYSRKWIPFQPVKALGNLAVNAWLESWDTKYGTTLVLKFDSPMLKERHEYANILGATYDFDEYKAHVTLSYDLLGQFIESKHVSIVINGDKENVEDLDEDWS